MRWSKLRQLITSLWDPALEMDIHCTVHRRSGGSPVGRYWVTLRGKTLWAVPGGPSAELTADPRAELVTAILREYVDLPREALLHHEFAEDVFGLADLLRAADRRLGKRSLEKYFGPQPNRAVTLILQARGIRRSPEADPPQRDHKERER